MSNKFFIFKVAAKLNSCQEHANTLPLFCLFYIKVLLLSRDFLFNTKHAVILIAPTPILMSIAFQTGHKPIQRGSCYLFRGLISNINLMKCCVTWHQEYGLALADDLVMFSPYMTVEFKISQQSSTSARFVGYGQDRCSLTKIPPQPPRYSSVHESMCRKIP